MNCKHENVEVFNRIVSYATREEPAEYEDWGECKDCGERLDPSDFPAEAVFTVGKLPLRGRPSEFYD